MLININGAAINTTATGEDVVTVIQNATNLNQLHDVSTNGINDADFLVYNNSSSNWENTDVLPVKHISPAQTANQGRPLVKLEGDWSHLTAAFGGVDISGSLLTGAANLTGFTNSLPFSAQEWATPNAHSVFMFGAQQDDALDDASHNALMVLRGGVNVIRSSAESGLPTSSNRESLEIQAANLKLEAAGSGNNVQLFTDSGYIESNETGPHQAVKFGLDGNDDDILSVVKKNTDGGSTISSQSVGTNYFIESEDSNTVYNLGGFQARYDSADGNSFNLSVNDTGANLKGRISIGEQVMSLTVDQEDKLEIENFRTLHKQRLINGSVLVNTTNDPNFAGYDNSPFGNLNSVFQHYLPDGDDYCQLQRKVINLADHATDVDARVADLFVCTNRDGDSFNIGEFSCKYDSSTDRLHELQIQCESQFEGGNIVKGIMLATAKQMRVTVPTAFATIDSGTTLPVSANDGDLFFHDTGTANIVKVWAIDTWYNFQPDDGAVFYDNTRNKMVLKTSSGYVSFDTTAL